MYESKSYTLTTSLSSIFPKWPPGVKKVIRSHSTSKLTHFLHLHLIRTDITGTGASENTLISSPIGTSPHRTPTLEKKVVCFDPMWIGYMQYYMVWLAASITMTRIGALN
jgi:hypothetical protein